MEATRKMWVRILLLGVFGIGVCYVYVVGKTCRRNEGLEYSTYAISVDPIPVFENTDYEQIRLNFQNNRDHGGLIKPRHAFKSYEEYIRLQLNKTLNPRLRKVWTTRDWRRKVDAFAAMFEELKKEKLVGEEWRALCIGARMGQEVVALKEIGVRDAVGIDLVAHPPLVLKGDMHRHPFPANAFHFEFSNAFDHALYPSLFASEIERTLKPGGVAVLHVSIRRRGDRYSANDLYSVDALLALFNASSVVHVTNIDAFGLDTQVVLRKKKSPPLTLVAAP